MIISIESFPLCSVSKPNLSISTKNIVIKFYMTITNCCRELPSLELLYSTVLTVLIKTLTIPIVLPKDKARDKVVISLK